MLPVASILTAFCCPRSAFWEACADCKHVCSGALAIITTLSLCLAYRTSWDAYGAEDLRTDNEYGGTVICSLLIFFLLFLFLLFLFLLFFCSFSQIYSDVTQGQQLSNVT